MGREKLLEARTLEEPLHIFISSLFVSNTQESLFYSTTLCWRCPGMGGGSRASTEQ